MKKMNKKTKKILGYSGLGLFLLALIVYSIIQFSVGDNYGGQTLMSTDWTNMYITNYVALTPAFNLFRPFTP